MRAANCLRLTTGIAVVLLFLSPFPCVAAEDFNLSDYFSREEIETATRFNRHLYALFFFKELVLVSFLGLVAFSRLASSYQRDVERLCFGKKRFVLPVYTFFILLMIRLVILPFDAMRDLVVRRSFGLTTQGPGGWLADQAKSFGVFDIWYVPFIMLAYATMRRFERTWWLISAAAVGLALVAWYSLAPHVVEPLFYRITPVRSEKLRGHLDPLLRKAGLVETALYEANSGKTTKEVNAYMSGLFLGRRIVLYDVMAEEADLSEIEFVVAHEIGHWKKNHILKGIALGTAGAAGILLLLGTLLRLTARDKRQGEGRHYGPNSVPVFFFWLQVILLLAMPVGCAISRRLESTADRYALELTQDPQAAVRLFQKVTRANLLDLNPPPLMKLWLYTHPSIPERIQAAMGSATRLYGPIAPGQPIAPPAVSPAASESDSRVSDIEMLSEESGAENEGGKDGEED